MPNIICGLHGSEGVKIDTAASRCRFDDPLPVRPDHWPAAPGTPPDDNIVCRIQTAAAICVVTRFHTKPTVPPFLSPRIRVHHLPPATAGKQRIK